MYLDIFLYVVCLSQKSQNTVSYLLLFFIYFCFILLRDFFLYNASFFLAPTLQQAPTSIKSNLGFCTVPKSSRKKADFRQGSLLKRLLLRPKSAKTSKSGRSMSFGFLLFSFSFFLNTFLSLRVFIWECAYLC